MNSITSAALYAEGPEMARPTGPSVRSPVVALAAPGVLLVVLLLLGPLAILLRYSFNRFVPGELM